MIFSTFPDELIETSYMKNIYICIEIFRYFQAFSSLLSLRFFLEEKKKKERIIILSSRIHFVFVNYRNHPRDSTQEENKTKLSKFLKTSVFPSNVEKLARAVTVTLSVPKGACFVRARNRVPNYHGRAKRGFSRHGQA